MYHSVLTSLADNGLLAHQNVADREHVQIGTANINRTHKLERERDIAKLAVLPEELVAATSTASGSRVKVVVSATSVARK